MTTATIDAKRAATADSGHEQTAKQHAEQQYEESALDRAAARVAPLAIEPFDKEWGVGVSGLTADKSPFPRVNRLLEWVRTKTPSVDPVRGRLVTEAHQLYGDEPLGLRDARVLAYVLDNCEVFLYDDELLVGDIAAPACECGVYPEYGMAWIIDEFENWPMDLRPNDKLFVSEETQSAIRAYSDYWAQGNTLPDAAMALFTEDNLKGSQFGKHLFNIDHYMTQGIGHGNADHAKVLTLGWEGIREEVVAALAALTADDAEYDAKRVFYDAALIVLDAVERWICRYGDLCQAQAERQSDPARAAELERMAAGCYHVAKYPPRDFWEAVQLLHFAYCVTCIEANGHSVGYGRFDVLMAPFYDTASLSREFCQELIENFYVKMRELNKLRNRFGIIFASGTYYGGISLDVGGVDAQGNDVTNDLSYMVLDAYAHTRMPVPWIGVRLHEGAPEEFKIKAFNVARIGCGEPKLFNDEVMIKGLLDDGIPLELARQYMPVGCVEPTIPGYMHGWHDCGYVNLAYIIQLALNDGRTFDDETQVGPQTGHLRDMASMDEVMESVRGQFEYWIDIVCDTTNKIDLANQSFKHLPYLSLLYHDCIEQGKDIVLGGARYNRSGPQGCGLGTCADILSTVQQMVFDEKLISGEDLIRACKQNWTGYRQVYAYVNSDRVHHYGNDDDYADDYAVYISHLFSTLMKQHPTARGGFFIPGVYSISINVALGGEMKASPDGRVDWEPISDCLGAVHTYGGSHDVSGPTAIARSVAKIDQAEITNGVILNWKFSPNTVSGETGRDNMINLIDGYFCLGGKQSQFNVITKETMLDAQKRPQDYRDLLVRVAGYSTYFTEMSPVLQDDLINRTELSID
jgi:formate C-acetyltransferase